MNRFKYLPTFADKGAHIECFTTIVARVVVAMGVEFRGLTSGLALFKCCVEGIPNGRSGGIAFAAIPTYMRRAGNQCELWNSRWRTNHITGPLRWWAE